MHRYVMIVNCAHNKGIGFVRNDIKYFAQTAITDVPFKSVVLLNADHLSVDAQSALRRCMEQFSNTTRFFGVANDRNRLICPILSRFSLVGTGDLPLHVGPISAQVPFFVDTNVPVLVNNHNRQNELQKIMDEITPETTDVQLMEVADNLYNSGITSFSLVDWIRARNDEDGNSNRKNPKKCCADMCMTIESERQNYRNDQLFLLRVADLYRCSLTN